MTDCDCTICAHSKKHPQLNVPRHDHGGTAVASRMRSDLMPPARKDLEVHGTLSCNADGGCASYLRLSISVHPLERIEALSRVSDDPREIAKREKEQAAIRAAAKVLGWSSLENDDFCPDHRHES